jgi:hypothetical protein
MDDKTPDPIPKGSTQFSLTFSIGLPFKEYLVSKNKLRSQFKRTKRITGQLTYLTKQRTKYVSQQESLGTHLLYVLDHFTDIASDLALHPHLGDWFELEEVLTHYLEDKKSLDYFQDSVNNQLFSTLNTWLEQVRGWKTSWRNDSVNQNKPLYEALIQNFAEEIKKKMISLRKETSLSLKENVHTLKASQKDTQDVKNKTFRQTLFDEWVNTIDWTNFSSRQEVYARMAEDPATFFELFDMNNRASSSSSTQKPKLTQLFPNLINKLIGGFLWVEVEHNQRVSIIPLVELIVTISKSDNAQKIWSYVTQPTQNQMLNLWNEVPDDSKPVLITTLNRDLNSLSNPKSGKIVLPDVIYQELVPHISLSDLHAIVVPATTTPEIQNRLTATRTLVKNQYEAIKDFIHEYFRAMKCCTPKNRNKDNQALHDALQTAWDRSASDLGETPYATFEKDARMNWWIFFSWSRIERRIINETLPKIFNDNDHTERSTTQQTAFFNILNEMIIAYNALQPSPQGKFQKNPRKSLVRNQFLEFLKDQQNPKYNDAKQLLLMHQQSGLNNQTLGFLKAVFNKTPNPSPIEQTEQGHVPVPNNNKDRSSSVVESINTSPVTVPDTTSSSSASISSSSSSSSSSSTSSVVTAVTAPLESQQPTVISSHVNGDDNNTQPTPKTSSVVESKNINAPPITVPATTSSSSTSISSSSSSSSSSTSSAVTVVTAPLGSQQPTVISSHIPTIQQPPLFTLPTPFSVPLSLSSETTSTLSTKISSPSSSSSSSSSSTASSPSTSSTVPNQTPTPQEESKKKDKKQQPVKRNPTKRVVTLTASSTNSETPNPSSSNPLQKSTAATHKTPSSSKINNPGWFRAIGSLFGDNPFGTSPVVKKPKASPTAPTSVAPTNVLFPLNTKARTNTSSSVTVPPKTPTPTTKSN